MKNLFASLILALAFVAPGRAAPVSFDFQGVSIVSVMQATYKGLLQRDYVISPDVLALDKRISMSVKAMDPADVGPFVDGLLLQEGIQVDKAPGGIYRLSIAKSVPAQESAPVGVVAGAPGQSSRPNGAGQVGDVPPALPVDEVKTFRPQNRSVDFMVTVLNAAFGSQLARPAGQFVAIGAPKERLAAVLELCSVVDTLPPTVEVSASFVEVTTTASSSGGLSLAADVLGARLGVSVGSPVAGSLSVTSGSFALVVDALAADGRFKQVSNSRVVGDDSEKMNLTVGDETPTLQSSGRDNTGNAVNSIVYRSSGVILDVLPRVLGSGRVALVVDGQVSSFKATSTGVTGSPTLSKRQVKTAVTIRDGDVLLIGGLEDSSTSQDSSGFSFLPRSLAGKSSRDQRTDLILILSAKTLAQK